MNEVRISGRLISAPKYQDHQCTAWIGFAKNRPLQICTVGELAAKFADEFKVGMGIGVTGKLFIGAVNGVVGVNVERLNRVLTLDLYTKEIGIQELGWNKMNSNPLNLPTEWLQEAGMIKD
jgi:hypothetical protein